VTESCTVEPPYLIQTDFIITEKIKTPYLKLQIGHTCFL